MYRYLLLICVSLIAPVIYASCDPFTIQCRKLNSVLTQYPLSELSMTGSINTIDKTDKINQEKKLWAIIKTPDHHVYPVMIGDAIGLEGGHVLQITSQNITVQQAKNIVTILLQQVK
jgi:Tfp pilus assembly protein PilP